MLLRNDPILRHELSQVFLRRGAFLRLLAFAALVGLSVFAIWPREAKFFNMRDRISRDALANLAAALQILVLLFGPAYAATSVTRDRERGFLETLLSGNFSPIRFFRGKWMAATAFLWMVIASTMPLAAIVYLLGGVSPGEFSAIYIELFLVAAAICAYGVRVSIRSMRSAEALSHIYVRIIPLGALWVLFPQLHFLWIMLPLFYLWRSRHLGELAKYLKYPFDYPEPDPEPCSLNAREDMSLLLRFLLMPKRRDTLMYNWENPVVVRELRYQGLRSAGQTLQALPWIILAGVLAAVFFIAGVEQPHSFQLSVLVCTIFFVPAIGASSFTAEIDQGTLDSLVITTQRRSTLILGKIWISFRMGLILLLVLEAVALPLMLIFTRDFLPLMPQAMIVITSALLLSSTISVLWSRISQSTPQSVIASYATVFVLLVVVPVVCRHLFIYNDLNLQNFAWIGIFSPSMPFLLLMPNWPWLSEFVAIHGSAIGAWDHFSKSFILFAFSASAVSFLLLLATLTKWRKLPKWHGHPARE